MTCDEYRKALTADPSESFDGGAVHASACRACSDYKAQFRGDDERLARALEIDVPAYRTPDLPAVQAGDAARVDRRPAARSPRFMPPVWIGVAAAIALVAIFGAQVVSRHYAAPTLAQQILAHMEGEQDSRRVTSTPVSERTLGDVLFTQVSGMDRGIGLISYAHSCVIDGNTVPHLVIQGKTGPITLILLPDEKIDAAIPLAGKNVRGVILPVGDGSVAIVGQREEQLGEIGAIGRRVADSVRWSI